MGNPHKGEVSFEANGQVYIFKLGNYALSMLERREKRPISRILKFEDLEAAAIQSLFYVGLFLKHNLTEEQVSDIIDEIGPNKALELVTEAWRLANPEVAATGNPNPIAMTTNSGNGIGYSSTG